MTRKPSSQIENFTQATPASHKNTPMRTMRSLKRQKNKTANFLGLKAMEVPMSSPGKSAAPPNAEATAEDYRSHDEAPVTIYTANVRTCANRQHIHLTIKNCRHYMGSGRINAFR